DLTQCRSVVRLTEAACCKFDERLMKLDRNKNYEIDGQLQSWKYFNEDLEAVREFVALKDSIIARAKRKISRSLASSNITNLRNAAAVGVHVRRGDKLHWSAVDAGVRVAPREFFIKAMRHFRKTIQGPIVFLVVTDDPVWCRSNLVGLPGVDHKEDALDEAAVDLGVLSLVDHSIITVGAFSWWAGFLARGQVVYYGQFLDPESKLRSQFGDKMADYVLPGWTSM
ncbi:hypothetical protein EGW08_021014, partial [Elysia chlorotica]